MSIEIAGTKTLHRGWTSLYQITLRLPGGKVLRREVEDHGNAVAVLPYDPARRTGLMIWQFRAPAFIGAQVEAVLETIAGIAEHEDAAEDARREAGEEAGLRLGELEYVGRAFTTPGISTEQMTLFLATYDEAGRVGAGGGVGDEDITVVELPLRELAAIADAGNLRNMTTFALVQTLRLRHPKLFAS
jgi:nudix-type nucleoside diphosphatase (YffH/AdpP family)